MSINIEKLMGAEIRLRGALEDIREACEAEGMDMVERMLDCFEDAVGDILEIEINDK